MRTNDNMANPDEYSRPTHEDWTGGGRVAEAPRPLVLVVEDDRHDWEIYGKILWYNGYDVAYAADGEEGLRLARKLTPDLVLVDMMLPGIDGLELCRRVREDRALDRTPIVMLTGRSVRELGDEAYAAGCTDFIEKPHSPVDLLHRVEELVGRPAPSGEGAPPVLKYAD